MNKPHHTLEESQQQWDEAIGKIIEQISEQKNIQTVDDAIQSLILTGGQYAQSHVHALYLQKVPESKGFTRKDISIYLAECDDNDLLNTYFQLVHFGGLSIEDSLRLFYTELRLEPLMNKNQLNILLTGLAEAYKNNGGNFNGDIQDAVRIYNAMIMLNDSLHNKNALGRSRQTERSFIEIINDRNQNNIYTFDEDEMRNIYNSIKQCQLQQIKSIQRTQVVTPTNEENNTQNNNTQNNNTQNNNKRPKSYSKYGKSEGQQNDIVTDNNYKSVMKVDYGDDDINPPQKNGGCCIVM